MNAADKKRDSNANETTVGDELRREKQKNNGRGSIVNDILVPGNLLIEKKGTNSKENSKDTWQQLNRALL